MKVQIEYVSPALAAQWLKLSKGNRKLSENYVLTLAISMDSGAWVPEASEVVFDESGALIDGHHRLSAVEAYGKPIKMAVKRGVPPEARSVIDTGRTRSLTDLLGMYRTVDYANWRRAALNVCVDLLVGIGKDSHKRPQIRTLDAYDQWMRQFKDGIDWVIEATMRDSGAPQVAVKAFSVGPILGAFAFAHKIGPAVVAQFHSLAIRGEGLAAKQPALTFRNYALGDVRLSRSRRLPARGRREAAIKTLCAIYAHMSGESIAKLQTNSQALPYFRTAYKGRMVDKLVEPFESAPESSASTA